MISKAHLIKFGLKKNMQIEVFRRLKTASASLNYKFKLVWD